MNQQIYITTTIPYVNSKPHIGHAQEFVIADCIARLYRASGATVRLQSGTDENAFKNVLAAEKAGIATQAFVDQNAQAFEQVLQALNISHDSFLRTTEPRHARGVELFWSQLKCEDLYRRAYQGLYCTGCEDFLLEKDLHDGLCPDHRQLPSSVGEENVFFRLSRYEETLVRLIESDTVRIVPETRKNEVLSFIRQGLQDISLTRNKERSAGWGIAAPGHADQVVYVWIDALVNYLSGQGFGESAAWKKVWNEETKKIHVIGKNVWKFHAVYWPALLLSAGLPIPNEIIVHGFLTNDGVKISKSLGNSIDPLKVVADYGADAVRHLLLARTPLFSDSDFSNARLEGHLTSDLANRLGNLYSRLLALCEKSDFTDWRAIEASVPAEVRGGVAPELAAYALGDIAGAAWREVDALNAEFSARRPWELLKADDRRELHGILRGWCRRLGQAAQALEPFLPETAQRIERGLRGRETQGRILFPPRSRD